MNLYPRFLPYGVAIGSPLIALLLSLWLQAFITQVLATFFYMAIALSAWYGGVRPGIVTIVLSAFFLNHFLAHFVNQIQDLSVQNFLPLVFFVMVSLIIALLCSNLRESKKKNEWLTRQLLQESDDRLKTALGAAQMGMWDWNLVTGEIQWSQEHEQLFGFAPGQFDGSYDTIIHFLHPDDVAGMEQAISKSRNERIPYHSEFRVIWADGSTHWLEGRGRFFYNEAGDAVRMSGTVMAIDQRKQAEEMLQEREALLRFFVQYAPVGIAMFDQQMRYVMASQRWVDEYGLDSVGAVLNRSHYDIFPEIPERWRQIHQRCLAGATEKCDDDLFLREDGTRQWIRWEIRPWHTANNEVGGIILFSEDITHRKQTEQDLQSVHDSLNLALSAAEMGTWDLDLINDTARRSLRHDQIFGYETLQPTWGYEVATRYALPEDKPNFDQGFQQGIETGELQFEARLLWPDQSLHWINVVGRVYYDEQHQPVRMVGVVMDMTARKQAEIVLKQLNVELEERVAERTAELRASEAEIRQQIDQQAKLFEQLQQQLEERQQAEKQLAERNHQLAITNQELARATRMKDEFLATMSHELRTPLNAILGMAEILQEQIFGQVNEQQLESLQTIEHAGFHLLSLINDILDLAKVEAGQIELECVPTDVAALCRSSLDFIKQQALKKQIHLTLALSAYLPDVWMDERRIRQVLVNLLNNAVKFTSNGGSITVEAKLTLSTVNGEDQNWLRLAITDTGIGIASENIPKLFQPFTQIDSALNRRYEGTGLGLALVKRLVELHGGHVGLTSELGVGSCFTIELPVVIAQPTAPEPPSQIGLKLNEKQADPTSPLILLAEDNESNILTFKSFLAVKQYRCLVARDGQEAIALTQAEHPNLILMDIQMPGMTGIEAIQHIRCLPGVENIPIIALTALAMEGDRERCLAAGANDYLSKPVKLQQLIAMIQRLLEPTQLQVDRS